MDTKLLGMPGWRSDPRDQVRRKPDRTAAMLLDRGDPHLRAHQGWARISIGQTGPL
jgi:hypothetical protein